MSEGVEWGGSGSCCGTAEGGGSGYSDYTEKDAAKDTQNADPEAPTIEQVKDTWGDAREGAMN